MENITLYELYENADILNQEFMQQKTFYNQIASCILTSLKAFFQYNEMGFIKHHKIKMCQMNVLLNKDTYQIINPKIIYHIDLLGMDFINIINMIKQTYHKYIKNKK